MGEITMANTDLKKNNSSVYKAKISVEDIKFFDNEEKKDNTKQSLKHFVENNKEMFNRLKAEYDYSQIVVFLHKQCNIKTTVNTLKTLLADTGNIYSKMNEEKLRKHYDILCKKLNINPSSNNQTVTTNTSSIDIKKISNQEAGDLFGELYQIINKENNPDIFSIIKSDIIENTDFNEKDNLTQLLSKIKTLNKETISLINKDTSVMKTF